eukprot:scpid90470/ scgid35112/ 
MCAAITTLASLHRPDQPIFPYHLPPPIPTSSIRCCVFLQYVNRLRMPRRRIDKTMCSQCSCMYNGGKKKCNLLECAALALDTLRGYTVNMAGRLCYVHDFTTHFNHHDISIAIHTHTH